MRNIAAHLRIDGNEAAIGHRDPRLVGANLFPVGRTPHRHQDHVVALRLLRGFLTLKGRIQAVGARFHLCGFGLEPDIVEAPCVEFLPNRDQVAIRSGHQRVEHFHNVEPGSQGRIDRAHFKSNDAAADDQQALGQGAKFQSAG